MDIRLSDTPNSEYTEFDAKNQEHLELLKSLYFASANFGAEVPGALKVAWLDLLRGYPLQQVEGAVKAVIRHYEYKTMPPFAVLQGELDDLCGFGEKTLKLQAIGEWGQLYEAISYFGYYSKPKLHPTTEYTLRLLGGWKVACMWNNNELEFRRKEFVRLWVDSHGRVDVLELGADAVRETMISESLSGTVSLSGSMASSAPAYPLEMFTTFTPIKKGAEKGAEK